MDPGSQRGFLTRRIRRAFTLLEVLVATAILILVVVLMASVFASAQSGLTTLSGSALRRQNAQTALMTMARELKEAVSSNRGTYELWDPANRSPQLLINPPTLGMNVATHNAHSIFWPSKIASSSGGSALVGYLVRWEQIPGKAPRPMLTRLFLDGDATQSVLDDLQSNVSPEQWTGPALVDAQTRADADSGFAGWLTDDILALYVRPLDPRMQPIKSRARQIQGPKTTGEPGVVFNTSTTGPAVPNSYDSRHGYQYSSSGTLINRFGPVLPSAVELVVVSVHPRALTRLETVPAPVNSGDSALLWNDVEAFVASLPEAVRRHVRTYSTIVSLTP